MSTGYANSTEPVTRWGLNVPAAVVAGCVAAAVEIIPVLGIQRAALGVGPERVFQSIASGALGASAYGGGLLTALLGVVLHLLISIGAAFIFAWTATRWPDLAAHPFVAGCGFGVLAYAVMTALVVPLSAVAFPPNRNPVLTLVSLAIHMLFFGLPIALAIRWHLNRSSWKG